MEDRVRAAVAVTLDAINDSLVGLGFPVIDSNPDFRLMSLDWAGFPWYECVKQGVAPFSLEFGYELNIAIGSYSEFFIEYANEANRENLQKIFTRMFRPEVLIHYGRWSTKVMIQDPGAMFGAGPRIFSGHLIGRRCSVPIMRPMSSDDGGTILRFIAGTVRILLP